MNPSPGICFSLLGRFCLYLGEREIPEAAFKSRKALSLLKLLAIKPKHQLHRDQAIDALWPELDPTAAAAQMYKSIHYIRSIRVVAILLLAQKKKGEKLHLWDVLFKL